MFRNYLTIAIRNLLRYKLYSAINIAGLAVGMACCFLILLFVQDELSYDRFHGKAERIHRVVWESHGGNRVSRSALTPPVLATVLKDAFPELPEVVRFIGSGTSLIRFQEKRFYEDRFFLVDPEIFDVFSFSFVKGDPKTALIEPYTIVITEEMAQKYFGDANPVGETLMRWGTGYRVTGVLKNTPHNSHFKFDFLASEKSLKGDEMEAWYMHSAYTYVLLPKGYDATDLARRFPEFVAQKVDRRSAANLALSLQPLTDIHLRSHLDNEIEPNGDIQYLYIFGAIAVLILLIACINFINLSTARSAHRAREVGMRKVLGAHRLQLARQFLGDSVLVSLIAFLLAVSLVELMLPGFNALFGKQLSGHYLDKPQTLIGYVLVALFVGIISGAYSAFFLSSFQPVQVMRGRLRWGSLNAWLRRGLVTTQFVISIALIVCTAVIHAQLRFIQTVKLGFNKAQVVVVSRGRALGKQYAPFKNALLAHPNVLAVTSGDTPGGVSRTSEFGQKDGSTLRCYHYEVDYDYLETLGIDLISGRDFSRDRGADSDARIVNEACAALLKRKDVFFERSDRVIGVVRDFHTLSLRQKIEPLMITLKPGTHADVLVRIGTGDVRETLAFLKAEWEAFVKDRPFVYSFLDEDLDRFYRAEQRLGRIFSSFSLVAIFVACLGLFGLVSFTAERRTREIGVRKTLGASVADIVILLSKDLVKLVVLANAIAWPVAYYAMQGWLKDFAYRIDLGVGVFALGGILALLVALATVGLQAVKAALTNPADALRYE